MAKLEHSSLADKAEKKSWYFRSEAREKRFQKGKHRERGGLTNICLAVSAKKTRRLKRLSRAWMGAWVARGIQRKMPGFTYNT